VHPAIDWQAHYYAQAQLLRCSRLILLSQMVYNLFGRQPRSMVQRWVAVLEHDLLTSLSPHTLFKRVTLPSGGVPVPLMVCGGGEDVIIDPTLLQGWQQWMKQGDRLWMSEGGYFFHYQHPKWVGEEIAAFWASLPSSTCSTWMQSTHTIAQLRNSCAYQGVNHIERPEPFATQSDQALEPTSDPIDPIG
jgi:hypothetical protein